VWCGGAHVDAAIGAACKRIAPLWPLKNFVAVNPFLGFSDRPFHATAAMLYRVARVRMLMDRAYYRNALHEGTIETIDLDAALTAAPSDWNAPPTVADLEAALASDVARTPTHLAHVATGTATHRERPS
jgi:uncharacterized protein YbcC (UPF0753/DUF2309 family)